MKRITLIIVLIGIVIVAGYVYIRTRLNTHGFHPQSSASAPQAKPAESSLDLRPRIISKLQQIVKEGSGGLYNLSVKEVEPDIVLSKLDVRKVLLTPDTGVLKSMEKMGLAPQNIFRISFDSLHIDGIGIKDLLDKNTVDIKKIYVSGPLFDVYYQKRPYHIKADKDLTLYQRLSKVMRHIGIDSVIILNGDVSDHQITKKTVSRFKEVNVHLSGILVDSSMQYDTNRFLFAKKATITSKNIVLPLANHMYDLEIGSLSVSAIGKMISAANVRLQPKYGKEEFEQKTKGSEERYDIAFQTVNLKNIDWWDLANGEKFISDEVEVKDGRVGIYLDVSYPPGPVHMHNYPHQLLLQLKLPVDVRKMILNNIDIVYEEYHPKIKETGRLSFDHLNASVMNLTNLPSRIKLNSKAKINATASLIGKMPVKAAFVFNLSDRKNGSFSADFETGNADGTIFNYLTEPFGLFMIKRGTLHSVTSHVEGDNYKGNGNVSLLYNNLHITPLKKRPEVDTGYKKKSVTSLVANIIFIKNDNPTGKKEPRKGKGTYTREPHSSFFNLIWKTTLVGMLQIIGIPEKFAKG